MSDTTDKDNQGRVHCVKSVQIRSYFWSIFSCIRTEYRKIRTRNNSAFGHFSRIGWLRKSDLQAETEALICPQTSIDQNQALKLNYVSHRIARGESPLCGSRS